MALSLFGDGGDLSSLFQQASAAPKQAYAQPQSPPPSTNTSLQSLLPGFDLSRAGDPGYMAQFRNPALSGGMGGDGLYVDNPNSLYAAKGSDGNMYDIDYTGNGLNLTSHYGEGDAGGGTYNQYGLNGDLLGSNQFKNYAHNGRDWLGMAAMVAGGAAGVMGAGGAMASEGMSGMDMAADGAAGFAPSGYGAGAMSAGPGSAGWGMDLGGAGGADGAAQAYAGAGAGGGGLGSTISNGLTNQAVKSGIGAAISGLGGGGSGSGSGVGGLANLVAGGYDAYAQNQASNNMLDYMKAQQAKIDGIYSPTGPLATTMYNQMSAQDAAAGRNSQYGTRTTDFLGKFGGDYAKYTSSLAQGLAGNYQQAYNQQASAGTGLAAATTKYLNSPAGQGVVQNIGSYLGSSPGTQMASGNNDQWAQGWGSALKQANNGSGGDYIYG